jgi:hypothetical protein
MSGKAVNSEQVRVYMKTREAGKRQVRRTAKDNHARPTIKTYSFQYVAIVLGMIFYCRLPNETSKSSNQ